MACRSLDWSPDDSQQENGDLRTLATRNWILSTTEESLKQVRVWLVDTLVLACEALSREAS